MTRPALARNTLALARAVTAATVVLGLIGLGFTINCFAHHELTCGRDDFGDSTCEIVTYPYRMPWGPLAAIATVAVVVFGVLLARRLRLRAALAD